MIGIGLGIVLLAWAFSHHNADAAPSLTVTPKVPAGPPRSASPKKKVSLKKGTPRDETPIPFGYGAPPFEDPSKYRALALKAYKGGDKATAAKHAAKADELNRLIRQEKNKLGLK